MLYFITMRITYLCIFIVSMIFISFHLRQGGLNQQYRKLTIRRYILYLIWMMINQMTQIIDVLVITKKIALPRWAEYILAFYLASSGITYAIIRLTEPAVFETVKSKFCRKDNRGSVKSDEKSDRLKDSLNAFLTSSLNTELVYTILQSIIRVN